VNWKKAFDVIAWMGCAIFLYYAFQSMPYLFVVFFVFPFPFIYVTAKYGFNYGMAFLLVASLILLLIDPVPGIFYSLTFGVPGAVIGWFVNRKKERLFTFLAGVVTFIFSLLIQYTGAYFFLRVNVFQQFLNSMKEYDQSLFRLLESAGGTETDAIYELLNGAVDTAGVLLPSFLVLFSSLAVLAIQFFGYFLLSRLGIEVKTGKPFRDLSLPKPFLWYFFAVLIVYYLIPLKKGTFVYTAAFNLLFMLEALFMFQGLTFMFYFFHQKRIRRAIGVLVAILILPNPLLNPVYRILGIADVGFDLRKRINEKGNQ